MPLPMTAAPPNTSSRAHVCFGACFGAVGKPCRFPKPQGNDLDAIPSVVGVPPLPSPGAAVVSDLSRMKGNFHVRFLEGGGLATARLYSTLSRKGPESALRQSKNILRFG